MRNSQHCARQRGPDPVPTKDDAVQAIERARGASVTREQLAGTFEIIDSFRRPDGVWWIRAIHSLSNMEVERFATPSPAATFTSLKPGEVVIFTRLRCEECCFLTAIKT